MSRLSRIHKALDAKFSLDAAAQGGGDDGMAYAIGRYVDEEGYGKAVPMFVALAGSLDAREPEDGAAAPLSINIQVTSPDAATVALVEATLPDAFHRYRGGLADGD